MNFVAGYLILVTQSEEEAFWLLDALVGRILPGTWTAPATGPPRPGPAALTAAALARRGHPGAGGAYGENGHRWGLCRFCAASRSWSPQCWRLAPGPRLNHRGERHAGEAAWPRADLVPVLRPVLKSPQHCCCYRGGNRYFHTFLIVSLLTNFNYFN